MSCHMASEWNDELSIHNGRPKCAKLRRAPRTCSELDLYSQPIDLKPNVNYTLGQQTWENIKEKRTSRIANTIYNNITENRRNVKILKKLMGWWMYDSSLHLRCNTIESEMFALKTHYNFHCHYYWGGGGGGGEWAVAANLNSHEHVCASKNANLNSHEHFYFYSVLYLLHMEALCAVHMAFVPVMAWDVKYRIWKYLDVSQCTWCTVITFKCFNF